MAELKKDTNYAGVAAPVNLRAPSAPGDAVPLSFANGNIAGLPVVAATPNPGDVISFSGTEWIYRPLVANVEPLPVGSAPSTGVSPFYAPIDHVHVGSNTGGGGDAQQIVMGSGTYSEGPVDITATSTAGSVINQINQALALLLPPPPPTLANITPQGPAFSTAVISSGTSNMGSFTVGSPSDTVTFASTSPVLYSGFGPADQGILSYGSFSFNLQTSFDETYRASEQGATYAGGQGIPMASSIFTIDSIERYGNYAGYQSGDVTVNYINQPGANSFSLTQVISSASSTSPVVSAWWDNGTVPAAPVAAVSVPTLVQNITSGIPHLGMGSVISFVTPFVAGVFNNTYNVDGSFAVLTGPAIATTTVGIGSLGVLGVTKPYPSITDSVSLNGLQVTLSTPAAAVNATWGLEITTPRGNSAVTQSTSQLTGATFNVNTYPVRSTLTTEYFTDELYRISSLSAASVPTSAPFNYDTLLQASDLSTIHNGVNWHNAVNAYELILMGGGLLYANMNLASCNPAGPNYANRSGWQGYTRYWELDQRSNMTITLSAIALQAPGFTLQIKLPGITGWLNALAPYTGGTPMNNGDGCLVGAYTIANGLVTIPVTFGLNSTVSSNNMIITRMGATGTFPTITFMSLS